MTPSDRVLESPEIVSDALEAASERDALAAAVEPLLRLTTVEP